VVTTAPMKELVAGGGRKHGSPAVTGRLGEHDPFEASPDGVGGRDASGTNLDVFKGTKDLLRESNLGLSHYTKKRSPQGRIGPCRLPTRLGWSIAEMSAFVLFFITSGFVVQVTNWRSSVLSEDFSSVAEPGRMARL
jgi:hypothetical protein